MSESALQEATLEHKDEQQPLSTDALYLDTQEASTGSLTDWRCTPQIALANIFSFLPVLDRHSVAQVCSAWCDACSNPLAWRHFDYGVIHPNDGHHQFKNRHDELRAKHEQYLQIIEVYGNIFSRIHVVLYYQESFDILHKLAEVCTSSSLKCCVIQVHGSFQLTEDHRRILSHFLSVNKGLKEVYLKNIDFSAGNEQNSPLPIGPAHTKTLCKLSLVNSFRQNNLSGLMYLINLTDLTILPHQVRFTWLHHLAKASLHTLNIVNMVGVWKFDFHHLPEESWRQLSQCPQLRVNGYFMDLYNCSKLLCPGIPLSTLVCCEYFNLKIKSLHHVLTQYSETLTTFVYYSSTMKSYQTRPLEADNHILSIVQKCHKLRTVAIKDSLHSSTLLLMVQLNPNLQDPIIFENMIHYELYIPEGMTLSEEIRTYTETNFSRDKFAAAMSYLLKRNWRPLSQKEYFHVLKVRYNSW